MVMGLLPQAVVMDVVVVVAVVTVGKGVVASEWSVVELAVAEATSSAGEDH